MLLVIASALLTSAQGTSGPPIIVTGQRISDYRAALEACLARKCPPNEDIDATLALAESEIMAGEYEDARRTLLASLRRNKDEAKRYPVPVSDLYRANGKVAAHLGYDVDYYRSTWGIYRTLKAGLPTDDTRKYLALIEVAEMVYRTRGHERARLYYESIARRAREDGRPDIAAIAELRSAIRHLPPWMAQPIIEKIANSRDPAIAPAALEAKLMLVRAAYESGDIARGDAMLPGFAALGITQPILIYAPPVRVLDQELTSANTVGTQLSAPPALGFNPSNPGSGGSGASETRMLPIAGFSPTKRVAIDFKDMWMDVAFRITPEGKVADMRVTKRRPRIEASKDLPQ